MKTLILIVFLVFTFTAQASSEKKAIEPCVKFGGRLKMANAKDGKDFNLCIFGTTAILDKSIRFEFIHEKTLAVTKLQNSTFEKNKKALRKQAFDPLNKESDAIKNCRVQGGTTLVVKDFANEYTICRFSDYSGIEVGAFLRGNKDLSNHQLLKIRRTKS